MKKHDAIIIGAGPAGCAAALYLRQSGLEPVVLDRARFPRDKVCGEFISPAADDLLQQLGVLQAIEKTGPSRLQGVALSAYGDPEIIFPYPDRPGHPGPVTSLSVARWEFDRILVDRVKQQGIEILEEHQVTDFLLDGNQVVGVRGKDATKSVFELQAQVVIDAGGRHAVSLKRFNLKRDSHRLRRIALAAHWEAPDFPRDFCYMHVSTPGYTGISAVAGENCNVVLVVPPEVIHSRDKETAYQDQVLANPRRRNMLAGARPAGPVRTIDSLAYDVAAPPVGGLMLVGDAMGFLDPFTGEGIYLSLRSAGLAAETLVQALASGDVSRARLQEYDRKRWLEFSGKFTLSRLLQRLIYSPAMCRKVVKTLDRRRDLADLLIGVIGDYLPADRVLNPGYGARFLMSALLTGRGYLSHKKRAMGPAFADPVAPDSLGK